MEGFELVPLRPDDVLDEWQDWFDSDHTRYYTRSGRKLTVSELRDSIAQGSISGNLFTLGILDLSAKRYIGTAKIGPLDSIHGLADLSVLIGDQAYLGRGLAAELVKIASDWAFEQLGVRKLHSGILEHNIASIKAYTRAGWIVEGVLKKHYINDGIEQDWVMISKFNPAHLLPGEPLGHGLKIDQISAK